MQDRSNTVLYLEHDTGLLLSIAGYSVVQFDKSVHSTILLNRVRAKTKYVLEPMRGLYGVLLNCKNRDYSYLGNMDKYPKIKKDIPYLMLQNGILFVYYENIAEDSHGFYNPGQDKKEVLRTVDEEGANVVLNLNLCVAVEKLIMKVLDLKGVISTRSIYHSPEDMRYKIITTRGKRPVIAFPTIYIIGDNGERSVVTPWE